MHARPLSSAHPCPYFPSSPPCLHKQGQPRHCTNIVQGGASCARDPFTLSRIAFPWGLVLLRLFFGKATDEEADKKLGIDLG
jgi:hypothetical protein